MTEDILSGPSQNNRSKKRYRAQTSPANALEPTTDQLNTWSAKNPKTQESKTDNFLDLFSTTDTSNSQASSNKKETTTSGNNQTTDDIFGLFDFDNSSKNQAKPSTSNSNMDDFDAAFGVKTTNKNAETTKKSVNFATEKGTKFDNNDNQSKKSKKIREDQEEEEEAEEAAEEAEAEEKVSEKEENKQYKNKPDMNRASSADDDDPRNGKTKSIDVLPLLRKGIRMNKFKMNGTVANVRLFFLSSDNLYFCWSPNLDNKASFDMANLIKSDEERRILLESVKEIKRIPQSSIQNLRFIPTDRKSCTLTITYDVNYRPRAQNQKGRARSFTQGGSGLRAPAYKQICLMAYEPFHFEMVMMALEKMIAISKNPNEHLENIFELFIDFPKSVLPKHLRPSKYQWESLKPDEMGSTENAGQANNDLEQGDSY